MDFYYWNDLLDTFYKLLLLEFLDLPLDKLLFW